MTLNALTTDPIQELNLRYSKLSKFVRLFFFPSPLDQNLELLKNAAAIDAKTAYKIFVSAQDILNGDGPLNILYRIYKLFFGPFKFIDTFMQSEIGKIFTHISQWYSPARFNNSLSAKQGRYNDTVAIMEHKDPQSMWEALQKTRTLKYRMDTGYNSTDYLRNRVRHHKNPKELVETLNELVRDDGFSEHLIETALNHSSPALISRAIQDYKKNLSEIALRSLLNHKHFMRLNKICKAWHEANFLNDTTLSMMMECRWPEALYKICDWLTSQNLYSTEMAQEHFATIINICNKHGRNASQAEELAHGYINYKEHLEISDLKALFDHKNLILLNKICSALFNANFFDKNTFLMVKGCRYPGIFEEINTKLTSENFYLRKDAQAHFAAMINLCNEDWRTSETIRERMLHYIDYKEHLSAEALTILFQHKHSVSLNKICDFWLGANFLNETTFSMIMNCSNLAVLYKVHQMLVRQNDHPKEKLRAHFEAIIKICNGNEEDIFKINAVKTLINKEFSAADNSLASLSLLSCRQQKRANEEPPDTREHQIEIIYFK